MHQEAHRALIGWLWLAWLLLWLVSAALTKRTERRESLGSRLAHIVPLLIGALLLGWHDMPWPWLTQRLWPRSLSLYWIGVALLVAGMAFAIWARVHIGRNWSGSVTVKQDHELITSGPYAWVRHPIYTGLVSAVLGTAIASGTVRALLGLLIITVSLLRKLRTEESFMRETFPGQYQRYSATVPALIPFIRPRQSAPR